MKHLLKFETQSSYDAAQSGLITPNVSLTLDNDVVHFKPYVPTPVETSFVAKFNVTDTSNPTKICNQTNGFSVMEIDGGAPTAAATGYTFTTTGEHIVKYTLTDQTSIGDYAFNSCSGLTSVTIPNSVTSIGESALSRCSGLTSVTIPNSVTSIGWSVFSRCSGLTSVVIPDSVTSIGAYAFEYCNSLTSVVIPDSVTSIGQKAFQECSGLTSCTIGSGVTSIEQYIFLDCTSLTSIDIPNSVTSIGEGAFDSCHSLTSINIPDSVTRIGSDAFAYCSGLTTCTIGSAVTSIGGNAFVSCSGLISIASNATTAPTIQSSTFQNVKTGGTLYVPIGSSGYDTWMQHVYYYLGLYNWTKVAQ